MSNVLRERIVLLSGINDYAFVNDVECYLQSQEIENPTDEQILDEIDFALSEWAVNHAEAMVS